MSGRERTLVILLLGAVLIGGGFIGVNWVYFPAIRDRNKKIDQVRKERDAAQAKLDKIINDRPRLDQFRRLSLPPSIDLDHREYEKYLRDLLGEAKFNSDVVTVKADQPDISTSPKNAKKEAYYTVLPFKIEASGSLESIVHFMEEFYHTALLHRIKSISIQRPQTTTAQQTAGDLKLDMAVEALIVLGSKPREHLMPAHHIHDDPRLPFIDAVTAMQGGIPGMGMLQWVLGPEGPLGPGRLADPPRDYALIATRNIFTGPTQVERTRVTRAEETAYTFLTDISQTAQGNQGIIFDRYNNKTYRKLRPDNYETIPLLHDPNWYTLIRGKVVKVDDRDLIFRVQLVTSEDSGATEGGVYSVSQTEWKKLSGQKEFKNADPNVVYKIERAYWDSLLDARLATESRGSVRFTTAADWTILPGKVLKSEEQWVYISVDKKFCSLHVGNNLDDALRRPLLSSDLDKLGIKEPAATKVTSADSAD